MNRHPGILYFYPLKPSKMKVFEKASQSVRTGMYVDHLMSIGRKIGLGDYYLSGIVELRKKYKRTKSMISHPRDTAIGDIEIGQMAGKLQNLVDNGMDEKIYYKYRNELYGITEQLEKEILNRRFKDANVEERRDIFKLVYSFATDEMLDKFYPQQ